MSCLPKVGCALLACAGLLCAEAAEEKRLTTNAPPLVTGALPFTLTPGTNKVVIRGLALTNATAIRFLLATNFSVEITNRGKATVPDKGDPKKMGDTQLEVSLVVPENTERGDVEFVVVTPTGESNTNFLSVVPAGALFAEKEPNPGFRKANNIGRAGFIRGTVGEGSDVDVFRFSGKAGQKISIETKTTRFGSTLDALVTLLDAKGHILKTSDDAAGFDARISRLLPHDGDYFLAITDAHDRGGLTYQYLIELK
jgi:hypothetical protein